MHDHRFSRHFLFFITNSHPSSLWSHSLYFPIGSLALSRSLALCHSLSFSRSLSLSFALLLSVRREERNLIFWKGRRKERGIWVAIMAYVYGGIKCGVYDRTDWFLCRIKCFWGLRTTSITIHCQDVKNRPSNQTNFAYNCLYLQKMKWID